MSGCGVPFKRSRRWQTFCSSKCRNDFHATEARIEAIRAKALPMYEALRIVREVIRGNDLEQVWLNYPNEPAETPGTMIDRLIGNLKAP